MSLFKIHICSAVSLERFSMVGPLFDGIMIDLDMPDRDSDANSIAARQSDAVGGTVTDTVQQSICHLKRDAESVKTLNMPTSDLHAEQKMTSSRVKSPLGTAFVLVAEAFSNTE